MKGSQVLLVLIVLIGLGIAGLVVRVVSAGSQESVLSGLLPISPDVIDGVTLRTGEQEVNLVKVNDIWRAGDFPAFDLKLVQMWSAVDKFDGAQLIATNPKNHARMGADLEQGIEVMFLLGEAVQERFIIGSQWSPTVHLCYLRRQEQDKVYAVRCPMPDTFDTNLDGWRNPIVLSIPRNEVETFTIRYPDDEFVLKLVDSVPTLVADNEEGPANQLLVEFLLQVTEALIASGFASEDEAREIDFDFPDVSLLVRTREDSQYPTTRVIFVKRPDGDYYVKNTSTRTVFIVEGAVVDTVLRPREEFLGIPQG